MQMVNGRDVMRQFSDPKEAVQAGKSYCVSSMHSDGTCSTPSAALSPTLQTCALNMLVHAKKVSCLSLLADLASAAPLQSPRRVGSPTVIPFVGNGNADRLYPYLSFLRPFPDVRTPNPNGYFGSPEKDYFQVPQRIAPASRWKEDWEELELLVS
jgi:translation initiation factor 2-alpha kinase 4